MKMIFRTTLGMLCLLSCQSAGSGNALSLKAIYAETPPVIDGLANDACWAQEHAYPIDQLWKGKLPHASDYMGRFKIAWDSSHLYILAEVFDDSLRAASADLCQDHLEWVMTGLSHIPGAPVTLRFGPDGTRTVSPDGDPLHIPDSDIRVSVNTQNRLTTWELMWSNDQRPTLEWARDVVMAIAYSDCDKSDKPESRMGNTEVTPGPNAAMGIIEKDALRPLALQAPVQR